MIRVNPMRHAIPRLALFSGATLLLHMADADASGFMVRENSAESVATVYAGNASRADDPATVFNNPAGMSFLQGTQTEIGGAVVFPSMHFSGDATFAGHPIPGSNDRNVGQVALIPHIYAVLPLSDRFSVGLAITVPFGNTVDYSENWSGRYVNIKTAALAADINPNIAYKITDRLSIAAGFSAQHLRLQLSSGIAQFLIFMDPSVPDGGYLLDASDWAWGYNFGILAVPADGTRIGLTYRSSIDHTISGDLHLTANTSPLLGLTPAPAKAPITVPASITGSITQQVTDKLSLSSDVQFTQWNVFNQVTVISPPNPSFTFTEHYRNSWMVSAGGVYQLDPVWGLRGGVGYDESPVTDMYRDTGVPDKDRIMVGVGVGIQLSDSASVDLGYAHYFAVAPASMNASINAVDPITGVVLHGSYHNSLDYLALSLRARL
jgi:long-chain fatty acid transport protein